MKRPFGVTIIAIMAILAGVSIALLPGGILYRGIGTIGEPWKLSLGVFDIAVGIGLLARSRWALLAMIAIATLSFGLSIVALLSGLRQIRTIYVFSYLFRLPVDGLIVWYLLKPEIGRVFAQPMESTPTGEK